MVSRGGAIILSKKGGIQISLWAANDPCPFLISMPILEMSF